MTPENNSQQGAKWTFEHAESDVGNPHHFLLKLSAESYHIYCPHNVAQQIIDALNEREALKAQLAQCIETYCHQRNKHELEFNPNCECPVCNVHRLRKAKSL